MSSLSAQASALRAASRGVLGMAALVRDVITDLRLTLARLLSLAAAKTKTK